MRRSRLLCACVVWLAGMAGVGLGPAWSEDDVYDRFYDDDTTATINFLPGTVNIQVHNFWEPGDVDWVKFNVDPDRVYSIRVTDQASSCDAIVSLYHESNLTTPLVVRDDWGPGVADEEINWFSTATSGTMFVSITQSPYTPGVWGEGTTYTLRVTGVWGDSAGLATISGTSRRRIGPEGGLLRVPQNQESSTALPQKHNGTPRYIYTKHQVLFPPKALDRVHEFIIGAPGDLGNDPDEPYTIVWVAEHSHMSSVGLIRNCSVVRIQMETSPTLLQPVLLTVEFVDDGPTTNGFTIDDVPDWADPATMRIHSWNGSEWEILDTEQWVIGDTVSAYITELGTVTASSGNLSFSVFAVAPVQATTGARYWSVYP